MHANDKIDYSITLRWNRNCKIWREKIENENASGRACPTGFDPLWFPAAFSFQFHLLPLHLLIHLPLLIPPPYIPTPPSLIAQHSSFYSFQNNQLTIFNLKLNNFLFQIAATIFESAPTLCSLSYTISFSSLSGEQMVLISTTPCFQSCVFDSYHNWLQVGIRAPLIISSMLLPLSERGFHAAMRRRTKL